MSSASVMTTTWRRRRHLDLIRVAVLGGLVFYHTACI
jgi:hypothetical protein